jgi:hypothetical protein
MPRYSHPLRVAPRDVARDRFGGTAWHVFNPAVLEKKIAAKIWSIKGKIFVRRSRVDAALAACTSPSNSARPARA